MLEAVEDEDAEFLEAMVARGVTLGVDEEMPRTPKVFEEKLKWSRDFVDYMLAEQFSSNYESAVDAEGHQETSGRGSSGGHHTLPS